MKNSILPTIVLLAGLFSGGCSVKPQPIPYGQVGCAYCQMTVVKPQFASELVSSTGKIYYFDAIECMVHFIADHPETSWRFQLVGDYFDPGKELDAEDASYLISQAIPSPMGANLSATSDASLWQSVTRDQTGSLYTWEELKKELAQ